MCVASGRHGMYGAKYSGKDWSWPRNEGLARAVLAWSAAKAVNFSSRHGFEGEDVHENQHPRAGSPRRTRLTKMYHTSLGRRSEVAGQ